MKDSLLVHKHLIVRAEAVKPPMDEKYLTDWLKDFITSINMKVLMGRYRELRAAAFASEADPLFFQEQRGELPTGTWLAQVEEIRLRYPSGGQA